MLRAAILFFVLALLAMLFGATGFAGLSIEIGRTLLFVFLAIAIVSAVIGWIQGRQPKSLM